MSTQPPSPRVRAIDLVRGVVMLLMAIDHVRVYSGQPPGGPSAGIFFTRWVTHFCAPAFIFLAGTSAFFHARRHEKSGRFLVTRGLWLVLLELTLLRLAWSFQLELGGEAMAGVIWAIGWCMVLLAAISKLPLLWVATFGLVVIGGHDLFDASLGARLGDGPLGALARILYVGFWAGPIRFGPNGPSLIVLYSIAPWVGVMASGFAFGRVLTLAPERRDRVCWVLGGSAIALFVLLRWLDGYGDPLSWHRQWLGPDGTPRMPALFAFLNPNKYPASLDFLLMTLGPTILCLPWLERVQGRWSDVLELFGRVPFFYYLLHLPLIHLLACGVSWIRLGEVSPWLFAQHPMDAPPVPPGYAWSLGWLYLVWLVTVALLALACRWFDRLRRRREDWWLRYL